MKVLLIIPSIMKTGLEDLVVARRHPTMDYYALADALTHKGATVDFLDYKAVSNRPGPPDLLLAMEAARRASRYDAVFSNSESVAMPLAVLFKRLKRRPRHIAIGHRLTTRKKQLFFRLLKVQKQIDCLFVYAATQLRHGISVLGIPEAQIRLIHFHADADFFQPQADAIVQSSQISSAGLEWRDYPTLIQAARTLPDLNFRLAAASPWSKHQNETEKADLPPNVSARRYSYDELRKLYVESIMTVVPLYENDFQAGVTTILEAMATGKPVIATRTEGQKDVIIDGQTGIYVPPANPQALRDALVQVYEDADLRARLGSQARQWLQQNATLDIWSSHIANAVMNV